jgi:hypothetical protein
MNTLRPDAEMNGRIKSDEATAANGHSSTRHPYGPIPTGPMPTAPWSVLGKRRDERGSDVARGDDAASVRGGRMLAALRAGHQPLEP